jgi:hypothetical protein
MAWALFNDVMQRLITLNKLEQRRQLLARLRSLGVRAGGSALDFGCGTGLERGLYVRRPDQYRAIVERHFRVRRVDQDRGHVLSLPQNSLYNDFVILECGT